jgi:hypothetical protein
MTAGGGYLAALASRTLGRAPLLRPVAPSRFEPDRPPPGSPGVVVEATSFPGPVGWTGQGRTWPPAERPAGRGPGTDAELDRPQLDRPLLDRPLLDPAQPDLVPGRARTRAEQPPPEHVPGWPDGDGADVGWAGAGWAGAGSAGAAPLIWHEPHLASLITPAADAANPPSDIEQNEPWLRGAGIPAAAAPGGPASRAARDPLPAGSTASQRDRRTAAAGQSAADAAQPVITVRIGRIDVRAVQAPAPPQAAPPRRPPPGPSLEEHLRARDRARSARR